MAATNDEFYALFEFHDKNSDKLILDVGQLAWVKSIDLSDFKLEEFDYSRDEIVTWGTGKDKGKKFLARILLVSADRKLLRTVCKDLSEDRMTMEELERLRFQEEDSSDGSPVKKRKRIPNPRFHSPEQEDEVFETVKEKSGRANNAKLLQKKKSQLLLLQLKRATGAGLSAAPPTPTETDFATPTGSASHVIESELAQVSVDESHRLDLVMNDGEASCSSILHQKSSAHQMPGLPEETVSATALDNLKRFMQKARKFVVSSRNMLDDFEKAVDDADAELNFRYDSADQSAEVDLAEEDSKGKFPIPPHVLTHARKTNIGDFVNDLLSGVYSKKYLATHSLTGQNKGPHKNAVRRLRMDENEYKAIVRAVEAQFNSASFTVVPKMHINPVLRTRFNNTK